MFKIDKKVEYSSKPRPILVKFENLVTRNLNLDNSNKLRESDQFRKVILSEDLSKEDREECKKLFTDKIRIRGQPGPSMFLPQKKIG